MSEETACIAQLVFASDSNPQPQNKRKINPLFEKEKLQLTIGGAAGIPWLHCLMYC